MIPPAEVRDIERDGLRAVPSAFEERVGGWRLRVHGGPWRRANSVQTFDDPEEDVGTLAERCIARYAELGRRAIFKLTPASCPDDLDERLADLGLALEAPTRVMTRDLSGSIPPPPSSSGPDFPIELLAELPDEWLEAFVTWEPSAAPHVVDLRTLLGGIEAERRFAVVRGPRGPVALGLAVLGDRRVGLFDLLTAPEERGRGLGSGVVERLIDWGRGAGADTAWLQVMDDNVRALDLYGRRGFVTAYPYWFRVSSENPFA